MERVACIDVGTNTALLLVADLDPEMGSITPVFQKQTIVRLGRNVDEKKIIDNEARQRLSSCLLDYSRIAEEQGAASVVAVGTSALRDAKNRMEVTSDAVRSTGVVLRCISGEEEAELTFFGAVAGMRDIPVPFTVIDIGGGSTEFSMGSFEGIQKSTSIDIGSVRLTERFFTAQPPTDEAFEMAREEVNRQLTGAVVPYFASRKNMWGVAGTLTTIAQLAQGLKEFDIEKVHGYQLQYDSVHTLLHRFRKSTIEEITAMGVPEGRSDVITMGTLILHQFMLLLGVKALHVSTQGLRFGLARQELLRLQQAG